MDSYEKMHDLDPLPCDDAARYGTTAAGLPAKTYNRYKFKVYSQILKFYQGASAKI
jgi:hypothetical protein